jgi:hypothetical protein
MAGKAIVTVELLDGTSIKREIAWTGGNPGLDAWEFDAAAEVATSQIRSALGAIFGDIKKGKK